MRATSFDQEAALAQGINVGSVFGLVWLIAGILAGFSGFFITGGFNTLTQASFVSALKSLTSCGNWWVRFNIWSCSWIINYWTYSRLCCLLSIDLESISGLTLGSGFSLIAPYLIMFVILLSSQMVCLERKRLREYEQKT